MYTQTTNNIKVTVLPNFLEQQSDPAEARYVWSYTVQVENQGAGAVQLLDRYWQITDAYGRSHEVHGSGVVGEQPVLKPGEAFRYTSGVPLNTPSGIMVGKYHMKSDDGGEIDVPVPAFSLDSPYGMTSVN
jgi:ApaG protein